MKGHCVYMDWLLSNILGWSAPSAIMTGGMGFGGQVGAELTDFIMVLNSKTAVKTFMHTGSITLGGNISGKVTSSKTCITPIS